MSHNSVFSTTNQPLVLIVDDEPAILQTLQDSLEDEGFCVETLQDGTKTLETLGSLVPDVVLLDVFMPNINGLDILERIKQEYPSQQVIIISGFGTVPIAVDAVKRGARDFIEKPLNFEEILRKLSFLKKDSDSVLIPLNNNGYNLREFGIVGTSTLFLELIRQIRNVATLCYPILIYGQHGTGKTLFAHYIHSISKYSNKPMYIIDCTRNNIQDKLQENPDGGVFFKNIHELSLENQKHVLSFISSRTDNIQIIASTSAQLFSLVQSGFFNKTLFYKLNIVPLEIAPLNKRRYDIPLLIEYFIDSENKKQCRSAVMSSRGLRLLRNYSWIGNVTQLKSIIERLVALTAYEETIITPTMVESTLPESEQSLVDEQLFTKFDSLQEATERFEKEFFLHLLKKHRFDLSQISDQLNIPLPDLKARMFKLNLVAKF